MRAYRAVWMMVAASRQSVPFLAERLRPEQPIPNDRLQKLIADLDSGQLNVRNRAAAELEKLGELAESALRRALEDKPALEVRQRLEALLDRIEHRTLSSNQLAFLRALEVLEQIGTPEALRSVERLATGAPEARLTQEARASLERLAKRRGGER